MTAAELLAEVVAFAARVCPECCGRKRVVRRQRGRYKLRRCPSCRGRGYDADPARLRVFLVKVGRA